MCGEACGKLALLRPSSLSKCRSCRTVDWFVPSLQTRWYQEVGGCMGVHINMCARQERSVRAHAPETFYIENILYVENTFYMFPDGGRGRERAL